MHRPFATSKFTPLGIPNLAQWFSADYGVQLDSSSRAAGVLDRSGNGRNLIGAGTTANPTWVSNALNGYPVFRFTTLGQSSFNFTAFTPQNNWFAIAAFKVTTTALNALCWGDGSTNKQILFSTANGGIKCYDGTTIPISNSIDVSVFSLVGMSCTAGTCAVWQNGKSIPMTLAGTLSTAVTISSFGQVINAAWSDMDLTEAMFFTSPLATQPMNILFEYFRAKYQIY